MLFSQLRQADISILRVSDMSIVLLSVIGGSHNNLLARFSPFPL